ncbi:hypothetical protein B0T25DRAFT_69613 [Lasiosphaeria hispida]|uniref:Uncharacterized protein n=1 Tax=Lasiosphaeria hispida TaxID=260671 RepID=A0AAJ0HXE0_9PEZI|nr:hypothetical protein B0T25DRAFT_69613 [Lasiosphaeria hispida]
MDRMHCQRLYGSSGVPDAGKCQPKGPKAVQGHRLAFAGAHAPPALLSHLTHHSLAHWTRPTSRANPSPAHSSLLPPPVTSTSRPSQSTQATGPPGTPPSVQCLLPLSDTQTCIGTINTLSPRLLFSSPLPPTSNSISQFDLQFSPRRPVLTTAGTRISNFDFRPTVSLCHRLDDRNTRRQVLRPRHRDIPRPATRRKGEKQAVDRPTS